MDSPSGLRTDLLAYCFCCLTLCHLGCLGSFLVWCLGKDVEFDCIGLFIYFTQCICFGSKKGESELHAVDVLK